MDKLIIKFLQNNQLLSFSVIDDDWVYSASCYYAFDEKNLSLLIKSDPESKHIKLANKNPKIAITIAKDSKRLLLLKGVQIKANFTKSNNNEKEIYYLRFPFAKLGAGEIYTLKILWAKYTDNKLLISNKIIFNRK
ncbi:hypothetical protein [Helicobacter sp. MIT 99-5507]|uniref:hypothetical protein n=1 Tax=Helicobacter sp. MIT 99-5507 TaxID=152489 RepID=UPI000E1F69F8|nr:hypothetical protein [Helicobacter sp. MIT 99-5507]RDU58154.1 hypothetical protein CQA42_04445 [Helicobacter sp. MIT 99-5507]